MSSNFKTSIRQFPLITISVKTNNFHPKQNKHWFCASHFGDFLLSFEQVRQVIKVFVFVQLLVTQVYWQNPVSRSESQIKSLRIFLWFWANLGIPGHVLPHQATFLISQIVPFLAILLHAKVKMILQLPLGIQLAESNNVICFFLNSESYINSF